MPIRIEGGSYCDGAWWTSHLKRTDTNERAEIVEVRGIASDTLRGAFAEMEAMAAGTRCDNYFFQANINPRADEHLTPEQWERAVDLLEENLDLTGHPRFVVEHEKEGRTHRHVVWSRIDADTMTAVSDSHNLYVRERTAHQLEAEFGLELGRNIAEVHRQPGQAQKWEIFRGYESEIDPRAVAAEVQDLLASADSGQAFIAALEDAGYIPVQGDKRDFCIIDQAGDVHSLGRRAGMKAADFRSFMADVDRATLPTVEEGKQLWADRAPEISRAVAEHENEAFWQSVTARTAEREAVALPAAILGEVGHELEDAGATMAVVAGAVMAPAGAVLGAVVREGEALLDSLADFFGGSSSPPAAAPTVTRAVASEREAPLSPAEQARAWVNSQTSGDKGQDATIKHQVAAGELAASHELQEEMRRQREAIQRENDRDR